MAPSTRGSNLGRDLETSMRSQQEWAALLRRHQASLAQHLILPEESATFACLAFDLRLNLLLRAYNNDYHCNAFEQSKGVEAIQSGRERVLFWGDPEAIGVVRALALQEKIEPFSLHTLNLGTATLFAGDCGEMELGRTASLAQGMTADMPSIAVLERALRSVYGRCRKICATPRNRLPAPNASSGVPIHMLHTRSLLSSFWGFAPWYVMQGGVIEVLDYREIYPNPSAVLSAFTAGGILYVAGTASRNFVLALLELNFGAAANYWNLIDSSTANDTPQRWKIESWTCDPDLVRYNPTLLRESKTGPHCDFAEGVRLLAQSDACTQMVEIPLHRCTLLEQRELEAQGYWLCSLHLSLPTSEHETERMQWHGRWARMNRACVIPHYLHYRGACGTEAEQDILDYARQLCAIT